MKKIENLNHSKLIERYPQLTSLEEPICLAVSGMIKCFENGGKLLAFGNGGSACDAEHICGELQKGFLLKRELNDNEAKMFEAIDLEIRPNLQKGLPAVSLGTQLATLSAFNNDVNPDYCYAQQVFVLGAQNDIALGISTSGNSKNVVNALKVAKAKGIFSVALTGEKESHCSELADITIKAPSALVHHIQELHLPIYHAICLELENYFYSCQE